MSSEIDLIYREWQEAIRDRFNIKGEQVVVAKPSNPAHLSILKEMCLSAGFTSDQANSIVLILEKFQAKSKETGKVVDFSSAETRDAAIEKGSHEEIESDDEEGKEGGEGETNPNFAEPGKEPKPGQSTVDGSHHTSEKPEESDPITDGLNDGNLEPLADEQKSLEDDRDKGTAGAGGAAASQGESRYCNGINEYDDEEFSKTNEGLIKDRKEEIKNRKKYPNAEEKAILEHLGLNPEDDEALDYLAKRELWAEQELARMKAMPKPNVLTIAKGFDGNDKAYMDWMKAAYDGMRETKQILEDSDLDTTKPHVAIQSTTETDNKVEKHLEEKIANAENDEDREYYEKELKLFKKYRKYHDTYVIGQDEKGRTHIVHVSNKKGSDLKDPHNNTTPAQRFRIIAKTFGTEVAQEITDAIEWGIEKVTTVREQTLNRSRQVEIDENFSKVAEKAAGSYINKLNTMADKRATKDDGNPRPGNEFGVWLDRKGITPKKWAKMSTEQRLKEMQTFMVDEEYHNSLPKQKVRGSDPPEYVNYTPPYKPFSKIFIKVGEKAQEPKFWRDNPELNEDGVGLKDSIAIKQNEKEAVKEAHDHVVNTITNKDKELGFPKRDANGLVSENGPNTQAYITTVMDAMHFSAYIDMADEDDNKMILQMGIKGAKASHVRECLAEKSGYDFGTREGLKEHIKRTSSVDAETGAIVIKGKDGETKLAEDTWRTAGDSQKVASGFGEDMRDCISEKVKK